MRNKKIKTAIYFVLLTLILVFCFSWINYGATPPEIMKYLLAQAGSGVGMSVSVAENPFNTLAQQLKEKETQLEEKEESLKTVLQQSERDSRIIMGLITVLISILFILILLNFYFDYKAGKYQKV